MPCWRSSARRSGPSNVDFLTAEVTGIERDGSRVIAVRLDNGERLEAGTVINAAGP